MSSSSRLCIADAGLLIYLLGDGRLVVSPSRTAVTLQLLPVARAPQIPRLPPLLLRQARSRATLRKPKLSIRWVWWDCWSHGLCLPENVSFDKEVLLFSRFYLLGIPVEYTLSPGSCGLDHLFVPATREWCDQSVIMSLATVHGQAEA